jgi:hypothetical protein
VRIIVETAEGAVPRLSQPAAEAAATTTRSLAKCARLLRTGAGVGAQKPARQSAKADFVPSLPRIHSPRQARPGTISAAPRGRPHAVREGGLPALSAPGFNPGQPADGTTIRRFAQKPAPQSAKADFVPSLPRIHSPRRPRPGTAARVPNSRPHAAREGGLPALSAPGFNPGQPADGTTIRRFAQKPAPQSAKADFVPSLPRIHSPRQPCIQTVARAPRGRPHAVREGGLPALSAPGFNPGQPADGTTIRRFAQKPAPQSAKADFVPLLPRIHSPRSIDQIPAGRRSSISGTIPSAPRPCSASNR